MTALNLPNNQMGDAELNGAGRDFNQYQEGVPFDQVAGLLIRFLDKQPQLQELLVSAIESIQSGMHTTDQRLDRVALILVWIAAALTGLTLVLSIVLIVVLFRLIPPQVAGF